MRVFVTGATGFIGSAIVSELIGAGHRVLGLARSDAAAASLASAGADVHRGSLEDFESLRIGAAAADGVIHTAFIHDFSQFAASCATDRRAIEAIGSVLAGTDHPLIVTSGTLLLTPGRLAPSVHGDGDHGFVPALIGIARAKGVSAYVGNGLNRWPAVHRLDAAELYRRAVEQAGAAARYHGVAEQGVPVRDIAEVIARRLNLPMVAKSPEEATEHFGWLTHFLGIDGPASSARTQERLGWRPKQPGLIPDLDRARYFQ